MSYGLVCVDSFERVAWQLVEKKTGMIMALTYQCLFALSHSQCDKLLHPYQGGVIEIIWLQGVNSPQCATSKIRTRSGALRQGALPFLISVSVFQTRQLGRRLRCGVVM